jgi:hypothetical protein
MDLPLFSPYPRPTHPNPLKPEQVEADQVQATTLNKRLVYHIWDDEVVVEVIVTTCVYGFPSCVLVEFSYGSGVRAESWNCYDTHHGRLDHEQDYLDMFAWIATKITMKATGSYFAIGSFGDIKVEYK